MTDFPPTKIQCSIDPSPDSSPLVMDKLDHHAIFKGTMTPLRVMYLSGRCFGKWHCGALLTATSVHWAIRPSDLEAEGLVVRIVVSLWNLTGANVNAAAEISERWGDSKPSRFRGFVRSSDMIFYHLMNWDQFVFAPSQLETTLQWNVVSNWLSSCTKVQFVKKLKLLTSGAHDHLGNVIVTSSFIGWVHSQNDFCVRCLEMGQVAHY